MKRIFKLALTGTREFICSVGSWLSIMGPYYSYYGLSHSSHYLRKNKRPFIYSAIYLLSALLPSHYYFFLIINSHSLTILSLPFPLFFFCMLIFFLGYSAKRQGSSSINQQFFS